VLAAADTLPLAQPIRRRSLGVMAGGAIAAVALVAAGTWVAPLRGPVGVLRRAEPPPPPAAPAKPFIALLPLPHPTGDDKQDYFAEGVTDEVIDALGRFNTVRVIGRNAISRYKKRPPTQEEITSELGANYLVVGSVRHSGNRVRIAAQLTDSRSGTVM